MIPFHLRKPHISDYFNGFVLAVILTAVPFLIVGYTEIGRGPALLMITVCAILQIGVHMRYFLHFSTKRVPMEVNYSLGLAVLMAGILIAGGIWVMSDLHMRMMP